MADEKSDDYFLEIESHFAARRGGPFVFSAKDWALMKSWHTDGVPLPVVIEAIDRCWEKSREGRRRRTVSSLAYCRHAVAELWEERKSLRVGGSDELPESDPAGALALLAEELERAASASAGAAAEILRTTAGSLAALAPLGSVPAIEEALASTEQRLVTQLLEALEPAVRSETEEEIDRELARFPSLDEQVRARTRDANLRRAVRSRFSLPRLSLFA
jgi:hypothetical protein